MQCRIAHLEKQASASQYWYHKMQVRAEETEAELAYMKQEWSGLESEKSALRIQVESQNKVPYCYCSHAPDNMHMQLCGVVYF